MITKKAEYAIIALTELAVQDRGSRITTAEIARRRGIPVNLIVQLISKLREAGLVNSARGPYGGVALVGEPARISLRNVIEIIDGPVSITRCLLQDRPCRTDCILRGVWAEAQSKMLGVLEGVTIKDLSETGLIRDV